MAPILRPTPSDRTAAEAAELLGLSDAASVRKLLSRGKIKGRLVGRQQWIKLSEIDKYNRNRLPVGRPMDSISGVSENKRGPRETEYQREYKRKLRAGLITPRRRRATKKSTKRGAIKKGGKKRAAKRGR